MASRLQRTAVLVLPTPEGPVRSVLVPGGQASAQHLVERGDTGGDELAGEGAVVLSGDQAGEYRDAAGLDDEVMIAAPIFHAAHLDHPQGDGVLSHSLAPPAPA